MRLSFTSLLFSCLYTPRVVVLFFLLYQWNVHYLCSSFIKCFGWVHIDFSLTYGILYYRAPSLKNLHIPSFEGAVEVFDKVFKKVPLLEDLDISPLFICCSCHRNLVESVCQACPLLRKLAMRFCYVPDKISVSVTTIMCKLRTLELLDCDLTADGLTAILHHCPVLESLKITGSFIDGRLDAELRAKCSKVKNLTLPDDCEWRGWRL